MTKKELSALYKHTLAEMEKIQVEYGIEELEDRLYDKALRVKQALSVDEARALSTKAIQSTSLHCILHGQKRGPEWYEKQAKDCARRAQMFARKGEPVKEEHQLKYQKRYEEKAAELRKQQ